MRPDRTAGRLRPAKRGAGKARARKVEFPGGKLHDGEPAEQALQREVREELACVIRPVRQLAVGGGRTPLPGHCGDAVPFVCALEDGMPRACEHAELRWIDSSDFHSLDWSEADLPVALDYFAAMR